MRGSREISLVPSLHRASTDALIIIKTVEHGKFIKRFLRSIIKFTFFRYTSEFNEPTHS